MFISANGTNLIKKFEGCKLTAYLDAGGTPTIGYGHTKGVNICDHITQAQADSFFQSDIKVYCDYVQYMIDNKTINFEVNQNMFDALVSFTYNLGQGNLNQLVSGRSKEQVASAMRLYINVSHKPAQGLILRRQAEQTLFLTPVVNIAPTYTVKKGDNLTLIAQKLKTTVAHLVQMNDIKNPNLINIDQILKY